MSVNDFGPVGTNPGMMGRIRRILLEPKLEWPVIDAEPMTVKGIMTSWVAPLAAIGPVAQLIGGQMFGYGGFGFYYRPPIVSAVVTAVIAYGLALLSVWLLSLIIDALAPTFNGVKNPVAAMKVAAFSMTASWLAQIFGIIPAISFLAIIGLYSLYLLYLGLPRLMRAPEDKAVGYTVVTILCAIVLAVVMVAVTSAFAGLALRASTPMLSNSAGGTMTLPGGGSVDLGKMNAAAAQMAAATNRMAAASDAATAAGANGAQGVVAPTALAALLPASIGGWTRSEIESAGGAAGGIGGSSASAHYNQGSDAMTLEVTDLGVAGAIASLGSALNVQSNKQTAKGYERTATIDGRLTSTKWDSAAREGEYSTVVANRFAIKAEGHAPDDSQFKAAVDAVDMGKLAALAGH